MHKMLLQFQLQNFCCIYFSGCSTTRAETTAYSLLFLTAPCGMQPCAGSSARRSTWSSARSPARGDLIRLSQKAVATSGLSKRRWNCKNFSLNDCPNDQILS